MEASDRAAGSRAGHTDDGADCGDRALVPDALDPLLAAGLSDLPRYDAWSGEMRLALAVVEDAIMTVRMTSGVATPRARRLAHESWTWLTSRDTRDPFAFENLCDHLGLNAGWLRNGLRMTGGMEPARPAPLGGVRRRHRTRR